MARVDLQNLSKHFGEVRAVDGVDLPIADGEFVAILGPSGCGKSSLLLLLAGIYAPTGGAIAFDGAVVNDVEARDRNVGIVFQSYALYPHLSVRDNIGFPLRFKKLNGGAGKPQLIARAAELVRIEALLDRKPSQLSGGQQQRVALARALIKEPHLLLLDEPLSNLDATLRLAMRTEIRRLQRRLGITTVLVTHDQIEATTMADRIVCMANGRIEQVGSAEDLYARPQSIFVAGFVGSPPINLLEGRAEAGLVTVGAALLPRTGAGAAGAVTFGIRPEKLRFAASGMAARIDQIEPMGREVLYVVESALGQLRVLEAGERPRLSEGAAVHLAFDAADTMLFDPSGRRIVGAAVTMPA
jgi:inositol-phosphate transport system ATP-binding protein